MTDTVPRIRLRNLQKRFGDKVVLDGIDLDVMPATSLVKATQDAQARYLQWMAEMKSGGQPAPDGVKYRLSPGRLCRLRAARTGRGARAAS